MSNLRDYQTEAVESILAGPRRVLYQLPVGGGKTYVACGVMRRIRGRVLVLAHRRELLGQMARAMTEMGIDPDRVTMLGPGSAVRRDVSGFALVIVDEAHRAGGGQYREILARIGDAKLLGLSASPYRREGLRDIFEALVVGPSPEELAARGLILSPRCWSVPPEREPDLKGVRTTGDDYNTRDLAERVNRPHLVGDIVKEWSEHAAGRSTLVFAVDVAHARSITRAFNEAGVAAHVVHGETPSDERDALIHDFDAGRFPVLVNVMLLTEGVDVRRVDCVVLARPTKSIILFLQAIGRGMRPSPTGNDLIVLDHSGAWHRHGSPMRKRKWSLDAVARVAKGKVGPAEFAAKRCDACGFMSPVPATVCSECGANFRRIDKDTRLEQVAENFCIRCAEHIDKRWLLSFCWDCGRWLMMLGGRSGICGTELLEIRDLYLRQSAKEDGSRPDPPNLDSFRRLWEYRERAAG